MAVVMTLDGTTREDYEAVMEALNLDEDPPRGLIAHAACLVDGQVKVTDIWESADALDTFYETRLGKAFAEAGWQPSSLPLIREAFNVYTP